MRDFTGDIYNSHKVFIRSEYESFYKDLSEVERLGDLLGLFFGESELSSLLDKAENIDLSLVYNVRKNYNERLRNYESKEQMWVSYKSGYIHKVTGEYVIGDKPKYDSYPCWCKVTGINHKRVAESISDIAKMSALALGIKVLFGGKKWLV